MDVSSFDQGDMDETGDGDEVELLSPGNGVETKPATAESVPQTQPKSQSQPKPQQEPQANHPASAANHPDAEKRSAKHVARTNCPKGQTLVGGGCCLSDQAFKGGRCQNCPTGSSVAACGSMCDCRDPHAHVSGNECVW